MEKNISIKLKAAFLLVIFALNTIVGFACSMGINMGFNSHHHDEAPEHIHANGKHHHHTDEHQHSHGKNNCCNDSVVKFQQVDKNRVPGVQATPNAIAILFTSFFNPNLAIAPLAYAKRIVRYYHPPPPDIRVLIQSFLI